MRSLRELKSDVWYEIRTAVNNREPLFRLRQTLALFAQVLDGTAERFSFEIRALRLEGYTLVFYIKPEDGLQLPRIMQWLKQTFAVRYNMRHGRTGHIWGDRYWSRILEGEPPEEAEKWSGAVMGVEAAELLPVEGKVRPLSGRVRPLSGKTEVGVRPIQKKPAKNPRLAAATLV
jgi:REP element-mobilizing transposase RayT